MAWLELFLSMENKFNLIFLYHELKYTYDYLHKGDYKIRFSKVYFKKTMPKILENSNENICGWSLL